MREPMVRDNILIRPVINGWILEVAGSIGMIPDEYVFNSADDLADFVRNKLVEKDESLQESKAQSRDRSQGCTKEKD